MRVCVSSDASAKITSLQSILDSPTLEGKNPGKEMIKQKEEGKRALML
ncbi:MAG: hypothetical protein M3288_04765 [Thermoproteota archaeon]|nr:hypothetical protein [Thermoproteota archaeon]